MTEARGVEEGPGLSEGDAIGVEMLAASIASMGVRPGDHLAVGLAMSSIGRLERGADTVIQALLEVITGRGTIVLNAYTPVHPLRKLRRQAFRDEHAFDRQTRANTGAVANRLLAWPGALRSTHPTNSIVAVGAMAETLTAAHDPATGAYSPYSRLADAGGRFLAIGIGDRLVGLRHEAQDRAGLLRLVPRAVGAPYRDRDGKVRVFRRPDVGGCVTRLPDLVGEMRVAGLVVDGSVVEAEARLVHIRDALDFMTRRLLDQPERYLCGEERCLACRTIERRLDLYRKLEHPAPFQQSRLLRTAIALENDARLKGRSQGPLSRVASTGLRAAARVTGSVRPARPSRRP